jgi:hypothetical protein
MQTLFLILGILFMLLTVASLLVGVFAMGKGGEYNRKNSNKLMRYRVWFQALALLFLILFVVSR